MNKRILIVAVTLSMMSFSFTANCQENKKAKEAREEIKEAKKDLKIAEKDSIEDFKKFKEDALNQISENQIKIMDLKIDKSIRTDALKAEYDKKIEALENKNKDLKDRMDGCSYSDVSTWEVFKISFKNELKELQLNIKNATSN